MDNFIKVDFHCHSIYSSDGWGSPQQLIDEARHKGIHRLAITDHNTIKGALIAKKMDPDLIIVGEEIRTNGGEVLALFVQEEIPSGLPYLEVIKRLKDQEAFISIPHPFDPHRSGWTQEDLVALVSLVDAIEVFNARCIVSDYNHSADKFACKNHLAGTAGSDAHHPVEIGQAFVELPAFSNAKELKRAINNGHIVGKRSPVWYHLFSVYANVFKRHIR